MTDVSTALPVLHPDGDGPLPVLRTDAVYAVRDAHRTARAYAVSLAMRCTAWAGPATGCPSVLSYVLESGATRLVVSSALSGGSSHARRLTEHVRRHGDALLDLVIEVPDAYAAYDYAVDRGASSVTEPFELSDRYGTAVLAVLGTPGPARHLLADRTAYPGPYLPGYRPAPPDCLVAA
ncbi:VOC family protein [Kitasatospora sp. NPDC096147]|uniref:VOC family protein n=1 Tax=Kitasatospora sp. NPDC096147 TaxID=3364093 RepID=UPI00381D3D7B